MAISTITPPNDGGLKSIGDLYDLINGKTVSDTGNSVSNSGQTTSTSGATSTVTENSGISQDSMNAMLTHILEGTGGLAAVSSGQRAAGGYGSSVNTMLTNDLLTRSASQVAALNQSKTTVRTDSPTTKTIGPTTTNTSASARTTGGVTAGGIAKGAGLLGATQLLGQVKDITNLFKKSGTSSTNSSGSIAGNPAQEAATNSYNVDRGVSDVGSVAEVSNNVPSMASSSEYYGGASGLTDFNSIGQGSDSFTSNESTPLFDNSPVESNPYVGIDEFPASNATQQDYEFADGGPVKKPSVLGSSQFNSLPGQIESGGFASDNPVNAILSNSPNSPNSSVARTSQSSNVSGVSGGVSAGGGGDGGGEGSNNSTSGSIGNLGGIGNIGKGIGVMGAFAGSPEMGMIGKGLGIIGSENPAKASLEAVANTATHGIYGAVKGLAENPSLANVADIVSSMASPAVGLTNAALGVMGLASLGQVASNAMAMANPNNPMSAEQMASLATAQQDNLDAQAESSSTSSADSGSPSGSDATGGVNGSAGNDAGDGAGSGISGGDASAADGGHITGPGTSVSDSIPAKLSDGEFVLSADVVKAIGVDKLQALQDRYHVPAETQKLMAYGRGS